MSDQDIEGSSCSMAEGSFECENLCLVSALVGFPSPTAVVLFEYGNAGRRYK